MEDLQFTGPYRMLLRRPREPMMPGGMDEEEAPAANDYNPDSDVDSIMDELDEESSGGDTEEDEEAQEELVCPD